MIRPRSVSLSLFLVLFAAATAHAASDVRIFANGAFLPTATPFEARMSFSVFNAGPDATGPLTVRIHLPAPFELVPPNDPPWVCTTDDRVTTCTHPGFDFEKGDFVLYDITAPQIDAGIYDIPHEVEVASDPVSENNRSVARLLIHHLFVFNNEADSGPGSLRDAIEQANAICDGRAICRVENVEARGLTIRPQTPLPAITACNTLVEARSTSIYFGSRNVELDGSLLERGNGLEVRSACPAGSLGVRISGFAIGNFPENGIEFSSNDEDPLTSCHSVSESSIGLDAGARFPRPNGLRGVSVSSPRTCASITRNYIGGNRASGVSVWATARTSISGNHIGWGVWTEPKPNGNGASGVFIGSENVFVGSNNIAFNGQFGISIAPWVRRPGVSTNVIHSNAGKAIDWNLDGDTPNDVDENDGVPNAPRLTSIRFFEVDTPFGKQPRLAVSGVVRSRTGVFGKRFFVNLYVNGTPGLNGRFEAFLPIASFEVTPNAEGPFEIAFESTPLGVFRSGTGITAQLVVREDDGTSSTTSELSDPLFIP